MQTLKDIGQSETLDDYYCKKWTKRNLWWSKVCTSTLDWKYVSVGHAGKVGKIQLTCERMRGHTDGVL